jgi:pimeloyl-ACP methyl ester carboxylesterase
MPTPAGWQLSPDPADVVDNHQTSLYFEVYEKPSADHVDVAVVFRGTNDLKDWWSNLRWFTRFIPTGWDQYTYVRNNISSIVDRAKHRHHSVRMITVGHSLGGGLAQQAAYAHPEIKYVAAFDPSPVTGFRSVPKAARDVNRKGIAIERVYERGEILSYLRKFVRWFVPLSLKDPEITEIRLNVTKGDPIKQHSMVKLARGLCWVARNCP